MKKTREKLILILAKIINIPIKIREEYWIKFDCRD